MQAGTGVKANEVNLTPSVPRVNAGTRDWELLATKIDVTTAGTFAVLVSGNYGGTGTGTVWFDGIQVEQKAYATPYVHTNGGSASRAASPGVQLPAALLNDRQGWMAMRVRAGFLYSSRAANDHHFHWYTDANNYIGLYYAHNTGWTARRNVNGTGYLTAAVAANFQPGDLTTLVVKWDASRIYLSVNGAPFIASGVFTYQPVTGTTFYVGSSGLFPQPVDGDVLWFACGTGVLADSDAAALNSYGNNDPPTFGSATAVWPAATATYLLPTESVVELAVLNRSPADTGATVSDSLKRVVARRAADVGASVADALRLRAIPALADTALAVSDSVATLLYRARPLSDAGTTVSESTRRAIARSCADAGATVSDVAARARTVPRSTADIALALGDGVRLRTTRALADVGAVVSDVPRPLGARYVVDTGVRIHDSTIRRFVGHLADRAATVSDTPRVVPRRALADTAAALSDSTSRRDVASRGLADAGLRLTDALSTGRAKKLADVGLALADGLSRRRSSALADRGVAASDSARASAVRRRALATLAITVRDSTVRTARRSLVDRAVLVTEALQRRPARKLVDVGLALADGISVRRVVARTLADTATALAAALRRAVGRRTTDTGSAISDAPRRVASRALADVGLQLTDSPRLTVGRRPVDVGVTISDAEGRRYAIALADAGLKLTDLITRNLWPVADTAVTISDSVARTRFVAALIEDIGAQIGDEVLAAIEQRLREPLTVDLFSSATGIELISDGPTTIELVPSRSKTENGYGPTGAELIVRRGRRVAVADAGAELVDVGVEIS
jgi:hypothetical protein